jgi:hypothetical protein
VKRRKRPGHVQRGEDQDEIRPKKKPRQERTDNTKTREEKAREEKRRQGKARLDKEEKRRQGKA